MGECRRLLQPEPHACAGTCTCAGNCVGEIKQFCGELKPGEGRLANCISDQIAESETADAADGARKSERRGPSKGTPTAGQGGAGRGPRCRSVLSGTLQQRQHVPLPLASAAGTETVTDACREEVYQFKISRNSNINLNVPLGA